MRMKSGLLVLGVLAVVVIALGWAVSVNNSLVTRDQTVQESWAQVQAVYQQRADLVPNLVETVKGFAAQERTVLEEVTRARASVAGIKVTPETLSDPAALRRFQEAQAQLGGRAEPPPGDRGAVPGTQVQSELPGPPKPAREPREPGRGRAAALQRDGPRLQYGGATVSGQPRGILPRLRGEDLLRGHGGESTAPQIKL